MKTRQHRMPIPQYEFPFAAENFNLFSEYGVDAERLAREQAEADRDRNAAEAKQPLLIPRETKPLRIASPYRLREGDIVRYEGQACPVIRVSECAAVITMQQATREFTTIFGKTVRIQPQPKLVRISSNSMISILNRTASNPSPF